MADLLDGMRRARPTGAACDVIIAADIAACVYEEAFPSLHETLVWLCDVCGAGAVLLAYRTRWHTEHAFFKSGH